MKPISFSFSSSSSNLPFSITRTRTTTIVCAIFLLAAAGLMAQTAGDPTLHGGNIRGIVRDEQGAPLAEVKVQMTGMEKFVNGSWQRELRLGEMPSFSTDKEGRFVVPVSEADMRFDFYWDKPGYAPTFLDGVTNQSELNIVLKRGLTVTGTVKRMDGGKAEPVLGSEVELRLPNVDLWYQQRTMTDRNGEYTFHVTRRQPGRSGRWSSRAKSPDWTSKGTSRSPSRTSKSRSACETARLRRPLTN